jgi:hypothetical protein
MGDAERASGQPSPAKRVVRRGAPSLDGFAAEGQTEHCDRATSALALTRSKTKFRRALYGAPVVVMEADGNTRRPSCR